MTVERSPSLSLDGECYPLVAPEPTKGERGTQPILPHRSHPA